MRAAAWVAAAYAASLLGMTAVHVLAPQRDGVLALSQVFAPHLFALLAAAAFVAVAARKRWPIAVVLLAAVVGLGRFGPGMVSWPTSAQAGERPVGVIAWNLLAGDVDGDRLVGRLLASDAELVSLEELRPAHVDAIESSTEMGERFPHRVLRPDASVLGMGLLSAHPLELRSASEEPPHIRADALLRDGPSVAVLAAHPLPPTFERVLGSLPISYRAVERDGWLRDLRSLIVDDLGDDRPVVVLGDFNVTDREPGYHELAAGMRDAHLEVGMGPGSTWRPARLAGLPFGVLRIDYVLTGGRARPLAIAADCEPDGGDHCLVEATVAVRR